MSTRPLMVTFGLGAGAAGACARAGAATPTRTISSKTATARFLLIYRLLSSGVKHGIQRDATARNLDGWMDVYSGPAPGDAGARTATTSSTEQPPDSPQTGDSGTEKRPPCTTLSPEGSSFLTPVAEGLQVHGGGLSEGRVGGELPGPAELGLGLVTASLTH